MMLIIHGQYHFGRKKVGAQKDFCNACERECLSELWRSFDCLHLFWVPFLPLGRHERWLCTLCNQNPQKRYKTRKGFKIAGLFVLAILLVSLFTVDVEPREAGAMWGARVGIALGFLALLYSTLKRSPQLSEDERRKGVSPLSADMCLYCRGPLVEQPYLHCPKCQIRIYTDDQPRAVSAPEHAEMDVEAVLANPDLEGAMSGFLASMEDESLWTNPVARRAGCLGIVYWRTACDGIATVISENGPAIIREAVALLDELGANRTGAVWKEVFGLFPDGAPPDDCPERESAMALVAREHKERLDELTNAFDTAFYEEEDVLRRLHSYVTRHKESFTQRSATIAKAAKI